LTRFEMLLYSRARDSRIDRDPEAGSVRGGRAGSFRILGIVKRRGCGRIPPERTRLAREEMASPLEMEVKQACR